MKRITVHASQIGFLLTASLLLVGCGRVNSVRGRHPSTEQVESLLSGLETNDDSTIITLPNELKSFSSTGEAYVTKSGAGTQVLFIHFMAKGRNMQGALYSTIPLTVNSQIEIESIDFAQHSKKSCRIYVDINSFLGSGWYDVSYWMD